MAAETDFTGRTVGRYQLLSLLGRGGMGAVYRAYDAALERHVAVKILPPEVVSDSDRVQRFVQEAKAASGLNHPHVVTVHDIGTDGSTHYIAMELIEGETLREKLRHGRLELKKAVTLVSQIADALAAAHVVGVIHRDLKPENLMVASSGYVKVLDFGLAKLRGSDVPLGSESATAIKGTEPGKVMGTVGYMSPEQAQGKGVDHRTDIFAVGCILYELSTGITPFRGNSSIDTMHRILYSEPDAIRNHLPNAPMELQWILRKALAKDPEDRYQSAKDMAIDLRDLVRELESNPSLTAIGTPHVRARRGRMVAFGASLVVVAATIVAIVASRRPEPAPVTSQQLKVTRVTSSGKVISAAISPDGKFVSYVVSDQGEQSLWLRQLSTSHSLQLVPPARVGYWANVFTPDGMSIIYAWKSSDEPRGTFYQVSTLGGTPRKITSGLDSPPAFSPDGKRMTWVRDDFPAGGESAVVVANLDGSDQRTIAKRRPPEFFSGIFFTGPSWSPDGKRIAASIFTTAGKRGAKLIEIDLASGDERVISDAEWLFLAQVAWLPDGTGLLAIARNDQQATSQVWFIPYPEGEARPITSDLFEHRIISLTGDGSSLLTVVSDANSDIWTMPADGSSRPRKLTMGKTDGLAGLSVGPRGRIVYVSNETGQREIWTMAADGTDKRQLTFDSRETRFPLFTPDGKFVVYTSVTGSGINICKIPVDGGSPQILATGGAIDAPAITPDGKWVLFTRRDGLAKSSIDGGAVVPLTNYFSLGPSVSPDGQRVTMHCQLTPDDPWRLCIVPITGGKPLETIAAAPAHSWTMQQWTPDGTSLITTTVPGDRANLWTIPLDGRAPKRITDFDERVLFRFDFSADRAQLVYSRGDLSRDAVLITGFR